VKGKKISGGITQEKDQREHRARIAIKNAEEKGGHSRKEEKKALCGYILEGAKKFPRGRPVARSKKETKKKSGSGAAEIKKEIRKLKDKKQNEGGGKEKRYVKRCEQRRKSGLQGPGFPEKTDTHYVKF